MQKQSGFIHDLCRLAKFWNRTVAFNPYVSGRSSIIECLAVQAGQAEEQAAINDKKSMLRAFRRFLSCLNKHAQIGISFTDFYQGAPIPKYEKPYIIDPVNPYHNFLDDVPSSFLPTFAEYSQETLNRLEKCEKNFFVEYEKLFDPQPDLRSLFTDNININFITMMISSRQNCKEKLPSLVVRRQTFNSATLEIMKDSMKYVLKHLSVSNTSSDASEEDTGEKVKNATKQFLNRSVYGNKQRWESTTQKHEDSDITFILPLNTIEKHAIYISMTK
jgi:hypothetical protein